MSLQPEGRYSQVLEIGPGMGVLTEFLLQRTDFDLTVVEVDSESVVYLKDHFPQLTGKIIEGDFLRLDMSPYFNDKFAIIGNFPYNISSQILFRVLELRNQIPEVAGMFQKEVAVRIAAGPGTKDYGILSVLLQAFYSIEYLFTVPETVFSPPPKVKSGVIRLNRNQREKLPVDESLFIRVVKTAFNQRRKTLRNALSGILPPGSDHPLLTLRAERLGVEEFIELTRLIEKS